MAVRIYKTILKFKKLGQQAVLPCLMPQPLPAFGCFQTVFLLFL
jgi:hypothetical protein